MKKCSIAMSLEPLKPALLPPMVVSVGHQARVPAVILCLKSGKFTLTRHEKPKSSCDQAHVLNSL